MVQRRSVRSWPGAPGRTLARSGSSPATRPAGPSRRTTQHFGNIIQKGQAGADGGSFKLENPNGILTCVFRGRSSDGSWRRKEVNSGTPLTSSGLKLTVDGRTTRTSSGSTGYISNPRSISIAGKYNCDQDEISCEYFTGDIDWVEIETG